MDEYLPHVLSGYSSVADQYVSLKSGEYYHMEKQVYQSCSCPRRKKNGNLILVKVEKRQL